MNAFGFSPKTPKVMPKTPYNRDIKRVNLLIADDHTKWNVTNQLETDTENTFQGRNTVKFTHEAGQGSPNSSIGITAVDLSDMDFIEFYVYCDNPSGMAATSLIRLFSGTAYYECQFYRNFIPVNFIPGNVWRRMRIAKTDFSIISGTPSWANIDKIYILPSAITQSDYNFNLAEVNAVKVNKAVLYMDFDDAKDAIYDYAFPIMEKYGLLGTLYVVTSYPGIEAGAMTWPKIRELAQAGWFIANHAKSHIDLATLTAEQLQSEFDESITALFAQGYHAGAMFLAAPLGSWNETCQAEAATRFIGCRIGRSQPTYDSTPPDNMSLVNYKSVINTDTYEGLKARIDEVISGKMTHHMTWHLFSDGASAGTYTVDIAIFDQVCAYIANRIAAGVLDVPTYATARNAYYTGFKFL